ncbi:putative branched chain amino acid periplasmic binding protein of ABC transporter precursor [Bosea sp. LC85]|uniref:ABC transporter substrate-binding protein n=1 Tax=Bosea sp. LC85 TaxID=1502851 RepID=UPI0004E45371|nr:ABC transporter substrate-binding protein [Bosea sp. LC85]KFC73805.1 putative branched chain amino acid periplasmic binding protein of ABC transporter precursor [Bosea sp. LC85]
MRKFSFIAASLASTVMANAQGISGDVIRIGVLNDQTGTYADFGGLTSVEAARMAAEDFGAAAKGLKIEIIAADHQNKADIASALARRWFDVDGVDAIADLTNSAVAIAVNTIGKERGKVTLMTGPATTRLTNEDCSPTGFHWVFDTYSQSVGTARSILEQGKKKWFLLTADYAFGHQMASELTNVVTKGGGTISGSVRHPLGTADFGSFLLQAQSSGAEIIGLANAGTDTINAIKQASEFGIAQGGQNLAGLVIVISDVHALGLKQAQGLLATTAFYWDRDDASREWSKRFEARTGRKPGMVQAGTYSSVLHYLKAIEAAKTDDGPTVAKKMRELPVNDFFATKGEVRADGRLVKDMYLVEVKKPEESKAPWDYYRVLRTIPAAEVTQPLSASACPLVKKN